MKCKKCNHLIDPGELHECPTPEYLDTVARLIEAAAQYDEDHWFNGTDWDGSPIHLEM